MAIGAGAAIQGIMGLAQIAGGAIGAAKGRSELESLLTRPPQYTPDEGIMGYYNQALQRAGVSPTESALYKRQMQNIRRSAATGLRAAQDRRSGLASAASISRGMSDAALGAESAAEQQQAQRFGALGAAAQSAAGQRQRAFDINVMQPWQTRAQMAAQRAAAGAQTFNIGASNIFGAGSSLAQADLYKRYYESLKGKDTTVAPPK